MVPAPIQFNCASGVLEGANLWERMAAPAAGAKISSHFSHRGYIGYANFCAGRCRRARWPSSFLPTRLWKYPMATATGASCSIAPIAMIPRSNRLQTVSELSILDRIKVFRRQHRESILAKPDRCAERVARRML